MARLGILLAIIVMGAAAPTRAWCEATCFAPADARDSHCPTDAPTDGTPSLSANIVDACPVLETARPTAPARLDVNAALIDSYVPDALGSPRLTSSFARPHSATTVFERCTPLRI